MSIKQKAIMLAAISMATATISPAMAGSLNQWPIYWEFSPQEVNSVRQEYGDAKYRSELTRRCRESGRSNHLAWWLKPIARINGYYFTTGGRHFCRVP
jgi:CRISPR/Cas system-associated endonuclease/helicase Cas3